MIAIVDYGLGNVGSIQNMLKKLDIRDCVLATTSEMLKEADKFILPGVGSFDAGMSLLNGSGMREELDRQVNSGKPILGICLGMQMLGNSSEEGREPGLGYIDFECKRFAFDGIDLKIPHMGWDYVDVTQPDSPLVSDLGDKPRFYFVHSYHAVCSNREDIMLSCDYGYEFPAAVWHDNIYGTQFHPEKSHIFGMRLLENFATRT